MVRRVRKLKNKSGIRKSISNSHLQLRQIQRQNRNTILQRNRDRIRQRLKIQNIITRIKLNKIDAELQNTVLKNRRKPQNGGIRRHNIIKTIRLTFDKSLIAGRINIKVIIRTIKRGKTIQVRRSRLRNSNSIHR